MLLFKDIYEKAINLFDDPIIKKAYVEDTVRWERLMWPHLENGINEFSNPTQIAYLLVDQIPPSGQVETFVGNGGRTYNTDAGFVPAEGADFSFMIGKEYDRDAVYANGVVTFSKDVPTGTACSASWYFAGAFRTDFSAASSPTTSAGVIEYKVKDILAHALLVAWASNERDFLLDIKNVLTDTDFKVYSPANSLRAKTEWVSRLKKEFDTQTNKLSWDVYSRKFHGGKYYG